MINVIFLKFLQNIIKNSSPTFRDETDILQYEPSVRSVGAHLYEFFIVMQPIGSNDKNNDKNNVGLRCMVDIV